MNQTLPGPLRRLHKIGTAIRSEGATAYVRRILWLGRYRHFAIRVLRHSHLKKNTVRIFGTNLTLPPRRRKGIAEELLLYGVHEPAATAQYQRLLSPGMAVVDVGTNLGYYLAVASARLGSEGRIIGIEADPELYEIASLNAEQMEANITVLHAAISDSAGEADFYPSEISNWGSLRRDSALQQSAPVRVQTITLDMLCEQQNVNPDAIRMDIEGLEAAALAGAERVLRQRPIIFMELHLYILTPEEKEFIADRLSAYTRFLVIDRYYDWPFSSAVARRRARRCLGATELRTFMFQAEAPPVVSLFALT